jgi:ATP-binding cassette, subfamily B, bacterial PglK
MTKLIRIGINLLTHAERRKAGLIFLQSFVGSALDLFSLAVFLPVILMVTSQAEYNSLTTLYVYLPGLTTAQINIGIIIIALSAMYLKTRYNIWLSHKRALFSYGVAARIAFQALHNFWSLSYPEYTKRSHSDEMNRINNLPLMYANNFMIPLAVLAAEGMITIMLITSIVVFDLQSFMLLLFIAVPIWFIYKRNQAHVRRTSEQIKTLYPKTLKHTLQAVVGWVEIKVFNKESFFSNTFKKSYAALGNAFSQDHTAQSSNSRTTELVAVVCVSLIALSTVMLNHFSQKETVFFFVYAGVAFRVIPSVNRILGSLLQMRTHGFAIRELAEIAKPDGYRINEPSTEMAHEFQECIQFTNVTFKYPSGQLILKDFNMTIMKNDRIIISGKSGEGKTTALLLLLNLIEPVGGEITIDGKSYDKQRMWNLFGYVPQNPYILDASLAENIAFGTDLQNIDFERIRQLLEELSLDQWVSELPDGVHTNIGENGCRISGGQRQRVAIARALYSNAQILLLDEITSQLDTQTASEVLDLMSSPGMQNKTIILITHRPGQFKEMSKQYILKNGKLVFEKNYETIC